MKRGRTVAVVMLILCLSACRADAGERLRATCVEAKSYTAQVRLTVMRESGAAEYRLRQWYRAPGDYRTEVIEPKELAGTVSVICGDTICLRRGEEDVAVLTHHADAVGQEGLNLAAFCKRYFAENIDTNPTATADGTLVLAASESSGGPNRFAREVTFEARSARPITMRLFDRSGHETLRVEYEEFAWNPRLGDEIFEA